MESTTFRVSNISCGHCVMTIQKEIANIPGVSKVEGDPNSKEVTVAWDAPATREKIKTALKNIDYPADE
jgi:copper chaperone